MPNFVKHLIAIGVIMGIIGAGIQLFKTGSIQEIGGISPSIDF